MISKILIILSLFCVISLLSFFFFPPFCYEIIDLPLHLFARLTFLNVVQKSFVHRHPILGLPEHGLGIWISSPIFLILLLHR